MLRALTRRVLSAAPKRALNTWLLVLILTLLAWSLIHFQINVYFIRTEYWSLVLLTCNFYLAYVAVNVLRQKINRDLTKMFALYFSALVIFCLVFPATPTMLKLSATSLLYWIIGFMIFASPVYMHRLLNLNFGLSTFFIILNTVPIFYWLGLFDLDFRYIERVGGEMGLVHLDPIYFGLFGATENSIGEPYYIPTARLQGWSSEPLHWGYFVFLACGTTLLLLGVAHNPLKRKVLKLLLIFIIIYSYFLHSSTVNLSMIAAALVVALYYVFQRRFSSPKQRALLLLLSSVIMPGLVLPFILASIPGVELFFLQDQVLGEGSNWGGKIAWLSTENLYGRFLPQFAADLTASHNFILTYYLNTGYILMIPVILFFYRVFLSSVRTDNMYICAGSIVFVITHTITIDSSFIYPSFVLWFLLLYWCAAQATIPKS